MISRKIYHFEFEKLNKQTALDFDKYRNYTCLLQNNAYFSRDEYMAIMEKEHQRLKSLETN